MLTLLEDHDRDGFRIRVVACDHDPSCTTRFVLAQTGHDQLWLCCGVCFNDAEVDHEVAWLLEDREEAGMRPSDVIEHGIAMYGLTWPVLTADRAVTVAQLLAYDATPPWMCRVPVDRVWACRRVVFGGDLVRVPRALQVLHDAYVTEGPAFSRAR